MMVSVGGLYFDAILKTDHTSKITMTEHPVELGANITDHSYVEPSEVSLEIGVSDSAIAAGGFGAGSRSVSAYQALRELQESREPLTVVTRLNIYTNMLISSITAPDDYTTMYALKAIIMLREVILVETASVTISSSPKASKQPQKTGKTNSGAKQPDASPAKQSVLKQAASQLGF